MLTYETPTLPRRRRWLPYCVGAAVGPVYLIVFVLVYWVTADPPAKNSPTWHLVERVLFFPALNVDGFWTLGAGEAITRFLMNALCWGGCAGSACWLIQRADRRHRFR